ncbi:hypothetical protein Lal_00028478 [Lupinus albus]|uniref:Putative MRN complex-interacting protein n=1 Tax=Lupinus albus TaxID=3870 RepID=A0A6A4NP66_LUPAL|nr:putative MRN complex-interacting protein [Lupinus albus]KAF1884597.1 hypothetical protein Lal_00028478 [Lupinus albus]
MSLSSTIFIALQCSQCSTMQVKQKKKKSTNKWRCVLCNQNQSLRKVFAQGSMAKDIRKFVQDFNISRKSIDDGGEWLLAGTLDPAPEEAEVAVSVAEKKDKKTDWTAYLDHDDTQTIQGEQLQQHGDDDSEPRVVTELDKGMFKKRRLVENSTGLGGRGSDKLLKKPFSLSSQEEQIKDHGRTLTKSNAERNNYMRNNNLRSQTCKPATSRAASKWNDYVTKDNDDDLVLEKKAAFKDNSIVWNTSSILEAITSDQRVEDDVHPDFL